MDARILWPAKGREEEHWGYVLGMVLGAAPGYPMQRPVLLGIRNVAPGADETHPFENVPKYDDTFVLFRADAMKAPLVFPGATHAYQKNSKASPDVNGDGVGDVGSILPGDYLMRLAPGEKYPVFRITRPDGNPTIPGFRDLDHDGVPDQSKVYDLTDILFHVGYTAPADSTHKSSIGCQTTDLSWLRVLETISRGYDAVEYRLRTCESLIELLKSASFEAFPLPEEPKGRA